jgi:hypothetical protein
MEIPPSWKAMPLYKRAGGNDEMCGKRAAKLETTWNDCFLSPGASVVPASAKKIALYHFATKSLEDFADKIRRGSGMSKQSSKGMDYFAAISRCDTDQWPCPVALLTPPHLHKPHACYALLSCSVTSVDILHTLLKLSNSMQRMPP